MGLSSKEYELLRGDKELDVALSEILSEGGRPSAVCFRDGVEIGGHWCRMPVGNMALLNVCKNPIFERDQSREITSDDCLQAVFICVDDNIDKVVNSIDDPERLSRYVNKFARGYSAKYREIIALQFQDWLSSMYAIMQGSGDESSGTSHNEWWADVVDLLASQYHWSEKFIMWELPIVRAHQYQQRIIARHSGVEMADDISAQTMQALDRMEALIEKSRNGES